MTGPVITDTGPLVALLSRREKYHDWAREQFSQIPAPALTCEAVLSECHFLLRTSGAGSDALIQLMERGVISLKFSLAEEYQSVGKLLAKYRTVPMSLADACLVRMSENISNSKVLTLDKDFRIYRKLGRSIIPAIMPE